MSATSGMSKKSSGAERMGVEEATLKKTSHDDFMKYFCTNAFAYRRHNICLAGDFRFAKLTYAQV